MSDDLLLSVRRPARYLGNEWNVTRKDPLGVKIHIALCFPDLYEVGMSNLGIRILYGLLNNQTDVFCERVFAPAPDYEEILRQKKMKLFSLESKKALSEFDFIGFSLSCELNYTNLLNLLDLAGIPLRSDQREEDYPLIIAGGAAATNPEPLADFIDLFVIGEAEEAVLEVLQAYRQLQQKTPYGRPSKKDCLKDFVQIKGVYIPSFYAVTYHGDGRIKEFLPKAGEGASGKVQKLFLKDLNSAFYPSNWLVPHTEIIHDRITLEVMRGCPNQCRFCQARAIYFPYRYRNYENLIALARHLYQASGYEEIALTGLSVSDYSQLEVLLKELNQIFREKKVNISLASLRANTMLKRLISLVSAVKKPGLTFVPEAATLRLRKVLNKSFDEEDFFSVLKEAYQHGYQHIKLYFMIGLPSEEKKDLDAIIDLAEVASELRREAVGRSARVNVSIATLIPKPHTPFQWLAMEGIELIQEKQEYLKKRSRDKHSLKLKFHNPQTSFLECLLSRGDRRIAEVILKAWQRGARLDAWDEHFSLERWEAALGEVGLDGQFYVNRHCKEEEIFPWDFIDTGIEKAHLWSDLKRAGL